MEIVKEDLFMGINLLLGTFCPVITMYTLYC